ncbi:hypothetical protein [Aureimonas altamirensis]|uniref:hypothetical protein n=1 Tax=Aureimonas altamirensis TaxID=370622 RepID=UPI0013566B04|nr:hypothetical protein [Aureimonas altamirensis]
MRTTWRISASSSETASKHGSKPCFDAVPVYSGRIVPFLDTELPAVNVLPIGDAAAGERQNGDRLERETDVAVAVLVSGRQDAAMDIANAIAEILEQALTPAADWSLPMRRWPYLGCDVAPDASADGAIIALTYRYSADMIHPAGKLGEPLIAAQQNRSCSMSNDVGPRGAAVAKGDRTRSPRLLLRQTHHLGHRDRRRRPHGRDLGAAVPPARHARDVALEAERPHAYTSPIRRCMSHFPVDAHVIDLFWLGLRNASAAMSGFEKSKVQREWQD